MAKYKSKTHFWPTAINASISPKCTAILFKNTGDTPANINGLLLIQPGEETPTISTCDPEVVDMTEYRVEFVVGSGGTAPMVVAMYTEVMPIKNSETSGNACEKL